MGTYAHLLSSFSVVPLHCILFIQFHRLNALVRSNQSRVFFHADLACFLPLDYTCVQMWQRATVVIIRIFVSFWKQQQALLVTSACDVCAYLVCVCSEGSYRHLCLPAHAYV